MNNENIPSTNVLLKYINATVTADSEADEALLLEMLRPTEDRVEMGKIYQNVLGYNPIEYFDEKYLERKYDEILETAPESLKGELQEKKDNIINEVMTHKNNLNEDYLLYILTSEIAAETGWSNPDFRVDIDYAIFEELGIDYFGEDSDDEDNDEEILDDEDEDSAVYEDEE